MLNSPFNRRKKRPQKAEAYLQEALKTYVAEGWALPITHTRKQLAECQKQLDQTENYLQTSSLLAGDSHLADLERQHFCQEILNFASRHGHNHGSKFILSLNSFAQLKNLHFNPPNAVVHVGGWLSVELTLLSQMPVAVCLDQVFIHVHFSVEKNSYRKTAEWLTKHKTSNGIITFPLEVAGFPSAQNNVPTIELYEMYEKSPSDSSLNTTGIICRNAHVLLKHQESNSSLDLISGVTFEESTNTLKSSNVTLQPGVNVLGFRTQVSRSEIWCYQRKPEPHSGYFLDRAETPRSPNMDWDPPQSLTAATIISQKCVPTSMDWCVKVALFYALHKWLQRW